MSSFIFCPAKTTEFNDWMRFLTIKCLFFPFIFTAISIQNGSFAWGEGEPVLKKLVSMFFSSKMYMQLKASVLLNIYYF